VTAYSASPSSDRVLTRVGDRLAPVEPAVDDGLVGDGVAAAPGLDRRRVRGCGGDARARETAVGRSVLAGR